MGEILQEICDWRGGVSRVDRAAGVIRGVKILGAASRNGRVYLPQALAAAAALYEGAKVNVNHPKRSAHEPRDYQDRLGVIRGVEFRGDEGLFGDLYFNPRHALAEQLLWDAEHAPENVGLSHNVEARTARQGARTVVEAILRVASVDLVADPATTRGLFEAADVAAQGTGGGEHAVPSHTDGQRNDAARITLAEASAEDVRTLRPDLWEEIHGGANHAELEGLRRRLAELEEAHEQGRRRETVRRLLAEHGLPDPQDACGAEARLVGPRFLTTLMEAADETAMRQLIRERAELVALARSGSGEGHRRPRSRDQRLAEWGAASIQGGADLARAISGQSGARAGEQVSR